MVHIFGSPFQRIFSLVKPHFYAAVVVSLELECQYISLIWPWSQYAVWPLTLGESSSSVSLWQEFMAAHSASGFCYYYCVCVQAQWIETGASLNSDKCSLIWTISQDNMIFQLILSISATSTKHNNSSTLRIKQQALKSALQLSWILEFQYTHLMKGSIK